MSSLRKAMKSKDSQAHDEHQGKEMDKGSSSSARPRRKTTVNYRKLNEGIVANRTKGAIGKDAREVDDDDKNEEFGKARTRGQRKRQSSGEESFTDEDDDSDTHVAYEGVTPIHHRFGKRRIAYRPKPKRKHSIADVEEAPYEECKNRVCVVCAKEMSFSELGSTVDLMSGKTKHGKNLYDLFCTVIKEDVQPSFNGTKICQSCVSSINKMEDHYFKYRQAAEQLVDTFLLGQKKLDSDVMVNQMFASGVPRFVDLSSAVIKIIDPTLTSFNALAIGFNFQVPIIQAYKTSIVKPSEMPSDEISVPSEGDVLTITFDQTTGVIEKTISLEPSEFADIATIDPNLPQIFMTRNELDALKKSVSKDVLYVSSDSFETFVSKLLFGRRIREKFLLSTVVAEEYERQIPGAQHCYTCSDCSLAFSHFHMLSNHVQSAHANEEDNDNENAGMTVRTGSHFRTGEEASLEKPFQCQHCDKCFSEYVTMSNHIDHYHGFSRKCNVPGCEETLGSIQDFVKHYVGHGDSTADLPAEFTAKTKVFLPCPMCSITVQGVWKFFHHTHIHDPEPRFKCPVCGKGTHKVQNFKDHLYKHTKVESSEQAEASSTGLFACQTCDKTFTVQSKLKFHEETHIPKHLWKYTCSSCDSTFPSDYRLKLHSANVHSNVNCVCIICQKVLPNRYELQQHMKDDHADCIIILEQQ